MNLNLSVKAGKNLLSATEKKAFEVAQKALEGKITTAKDALKYFSKYPNKCVTPLYKAPNGTKAYYTRGGTFGSDVIKYVERPNGVKIESKFFKGYNAPMIVQETGKNGAEIRHGFLGEYATKNNRFSVITTPEGNIYGYDVKKGVKDYYKYIKHGWEEIKGSQKYLEKIFNKNANTIRK